MVKKNSAKARQLSFHRCAAVARENSGQCKLGEKRESSFLVKAMFVLKLVPRRRSCLAVRLLTFACLTDSLN